MCINRLKIQVMMMWVAVALLGIVSSSRAADLLVWQFQHNQAGIQEARATAVDSHGNLIITGYTDTSGNDSDDDIYTIKISSDGQTVLWSARYPNTQGDDWGVAVAVDGNDDVVVTGFLDNGVNTDIAVIKYDGASGAPKWTAPYLFNSAVNGNDMPRALALDSQNNIYVAGYSQTGGSTADDGVLFKLNPTGPNPDRTPIWQVNFNGSASGDDIFDSISVGVGGIAITGRTKVMHSGNRVDFDYLTIKFDYSGNILWQTTYDHGTGDDLAYYAGMDLAGNVIITGDVLIGTRHDMRTIKYGAADGQLLWGRNYSDGSPNIPKGLVVDSDGEVYVTGVTFTNNGKDDFYTARYTGDSGAVVWGKIFHSGGDNADIPQALALDQTGGLYVTGYTHKAATSDDDFQTLKYNKVNGNLIWQQAQDGPPEGGNEQPVGVAVAMAVSADGNIYIGGWSQQGADLDYYALKYSADLLDLPTGLTATVISQTQINLTWQDNSTTPNNEDNFCVERCQGFGCIDFVKLSCAVAQDQTTYPDSNVTKDNWYTYRISAKSAAKGYSLPSTPVSVLSTAINFPAPDWLYTHDGEGLDDTAKGIAMSSDNNPVATGVIATANSQFDYYTVKLNRTSNPATPLWIADYDGPDSQGDMGTCLTVDSNNDVIVSGYSSINSGLGYNTNDIFTIKYASTGPDQWTGYPLWTADYNGPDTGDDRAIAIAAATDGSNYTVVTGHGTNAAGNDDIYLVKYKPNYDAINQKVWSITPYNGGFNDYPTATAYTPAGNVVVVGSSERAAGDSDIFISLYNGSTGLKMSGWPYKQDFGHGIDGLNAVAVAADNSIYVAGYARNAAGNLDIYVNKFNSSGVDQWGGPKIIDGDGHGYDEAKAIAIDPNDGDIVVAATVTSASGSEDFYLLRYAADGTLRWKKTLDLVGQDEFLTAMAMSPSGEICLVGENDNTVDNDVIAVKYDHLGNLIGSTKFNNGFDDYATAITVNRLGEFYISGYSSTGELATDDYDFVVFRFNGQELQAPSPFTVTPHNTSADLSWTENDTTVTGYKVYRKTGACSVGETIFDDSNRILQPAKGTTAYTDNGLNIGSTYCYGILAYRTSTGDLSRIVERQINTSTPVPPNNVVASFKNTSDIEVCWHDNSASEDGFKVQRCTGATCDFSSGVTEFTAPAELNPLATSTCYTDTTACDSGSGKTFRYRVQAYKTNAWNSGYNGQTDNVTPPDLAAPSSLSAIRVAEAKVDLQWIDNTVDETDFKVERCQGSGCVNFAEIDTDPVASGINGVSGVSNNALLLEMDEASWNNTAGQVLDYSGKGRNGTPFVSATTSADAHSGRSGSLNGSNHYITAPYAINQSSTSAGVTMMGWVKPTSSATGQHYLFSTEDGSPTVNNSWGLLRDAGTWQVATGLGVTATSGTVTVGQWQHVAVVFKPGTGVEFYINGAKVGSTITSLGYHTTSANFTIGRQGVLNQNFFDGLVDEVGVYDKALTLAEIQKLYSVGIFPDTKKWYTDSTVSAITDYRYRVTARKQTTCGTTLSPPSNVLPVNTAPLTPQPLTAIQAKIGIVRLAWTSQTTTQTGFEVARCNGSGCTPSFASPLSSPGSTAISFTDNTACYGSDGIIRYQIRAVGPWGQSPASAVAQVIVTPSAGPTPLTVTRATEASVSLNWQYTGFNRDGYYVERCTGNSTACPATGGAYTAVTGSPYAGTDSALQALWHMDELAWNGTTSEVVDSSGQGRHGTAKNGAMLDPSGASSSYGAGSFDGVNDYVETNLSLNQSGTTPGATFMAWVYPTENSSRWKYVFSTSNGDYDWGLSINTTYWYVDNGSSNVYVTSAAINTWQHVAVVFDPNVGVKFYLNGALQNTQAIDYDTIANPINLGRNPMNSTQNFAGKIDEVSVFSRVMSGTEISQHYNRTNPITFTDSDASLTPGAFYTYKITPFVNTYTPCGGDWRPSITPSRVTTTTALPNPAAPSGLAVAVKSSTELGLSWTSNTSAETGFVIERCSGSSCTTTDTTFTTGPGVTTYNDTSVCNGQIYRYKVKAVKTTPTTWETAYTSQAYGTPTTAAPVVITPTVVSESRVDLLWTDPNADEDSYQLSRCTDNAGRTGCTAPEQFTTILGTYPGTVSGVQLLYRMDEALWNGTASEVRDASGNSRHGTSYNAAQNPLPAGRFGFAALFNGSTSYVNTGYAVSQTQGSAGVTMEAWVYPTVASDANPRSVLSTENGGFDWGVIAQNGKWQVNTGLSQKDTGLTVDVGVWQHITAVFTPQSGIMFYKNAELYTTTEIEYDLSSNPLNIGRNASTTSAVNYFTGKIDEVLVYARPLTASEVTRHNSYQEWTPSTSFTYSDTTVSQNSIYKYRVIGTKAASCAWEKQTIVEGVTPICPAPDQFTVVSKTTTSANLSWKDNNGSETGYTLSRCDGSAWASNCTGLYEVSRPANPATGTMTYADTTLSQNKTYTYNVWAIGGCGPTNHAAVTVTTNAQPATPTNLTAMPVSEVQINLAWNFTSADETGVHLQRCQGAACDVLNLTPNTKSYADNELEPNKQYCYRVSVYKTATPGGWETGQTDPQVCESTPPLPITLTATPDPVKTTTVNLAWGDVYQTETGTTVQRCLGDLVACASGSFTPVTVVGPNQISYADNSVCAGTAYTYKVGPMSQGLSNGNSGCWTRRAPLNFTAGGGFPTFSGVEVVVPYNSAMKADFSDIRFYDTTAHRELAYWIKSKVNSSTATIWLMTGHYSTIYLYYGNALATDSGGTDALFTEVYDQFSGTTINPQKWVVLDAASDKIQQNNGLLFIARDGDRDAQNAAVISSQTFERAAGNELFFDFTVGSEPTYYSDAVMLGWEKDQTSATTWTNNVAHVLNLTQSSYTFYMNSVYEDTSTVSFTGRLYNDLTNYQLKIILNGTSGVSHGALYYMKGGKFTDWTLLQTTSTHRTNDDVLRICFLQTYHNITINTVTVKHASSQRVVTLGTVEGSGSTCLNFTFTWSGNLTLADDALTKPALPPTNLTASVVEGKVKLTWSAGTGDESEFRVERNCGSGYSQIGTALGGTLTYSDASMPVSTSCAYQVKGYKNASCPWTTIASNQATIVAPPVGPVVTATAPNAFQIRLAWPDAADEDGYDVEAQVFNGSWVAVASLPASAIHTAAYPANMVTYTDRHGINPSTATKPSTYTYRVRARRGIVYSAWGQASATTPVYLEGAATCPLP